MISKPRFICRPFFLVCCFIFNFTLISAQSGSIEYISGYITFESKPLKNVNVSVKDTNRKTISDDKGHYMIEASEQEVLRFSYVGMKPIEIIVEDVTRFLNIRMSKSLNVLGDVVISNRKKGSRSRLSNKPNVSKIKSAYGEIDVKSTSNNIQIVGGDDLWQGAVDPVEALRNQLLPSGVMADQNTFGGVSRKIQLRPATSLLSGNYAIWDIDGVIFNNPPIIDNFDIEHVAVLKSIAATTLYGMRGAGGVIVVKTKGASKRNKLKKKLGAVNQVTYKNDASPYRDLYFKTDYIKKLANVPDKKLHEVYKDIASSYKNSSEFYLNVANFFRIEKKNEKLALKVLKDMEETFFHHPEALKALAYIYEEIGKKEKATGVYYRIAYLRPSYAQSFRDLANAYVSNNQFKEGWDMYLRYLQRGFGLKNKGIEQIVYNEMQSIYFHNKEDAEIKETFVENKDLNSLESDVRVVFEWNTSEAEFVFEFVDPKLNAFVYEHSLAKNTDRIVDQKRKGYSCEEFFIYDMNQGDWLINMTYLGNKKYQPTYLKATVYKNWGRKNQTEEIKVFTLTNLNYKVQLFRFNSAISSSISSN